MTDQIESLKQLQQLDRELFALRRREEEKPQELERARQALAAQEASTRQAAEHLKALQVAQKEREVELQSREANVKKLQGQFFQVKTNKEYAALQREMASLKADNSLLEEAILKTFDEVEAAGTQRDAEQQRLAGQQQRLRAEEARVAQEIAELRARVERLERERAALCPSVPPPALAVYERVLSLRDGVALVPVAGEACGGCDRRLPPQVVNEVYLQAKLVTCEHCNRILYHAADAAGA